MNPHEQINATEVLSMCGMSYSIYLPWLYNIIPPPFSFLQMFTWCIFICSQGFCFICPWIYYLDCAWTESQMCWWGWIPAEECYGPKVLLIQVFPWEISKNGSFCLYNVVLKYKYIFSSNYERYSCYLLFKKCITISFYPKSNIGCVSLGAGLSVCVANVRKGVFYLFIYYEKPHKTKSIGFQVVIWKR